MTERLIYLYFFLRKQIKMHKDLAQQSIQEALSGNWEQALCTNKKILKEDSKNIDALNRLARCHAELGDIKKAKATSKKVIKLEPFNKIAQKCLEKWEGLKDGDTYKSTSTSGNDFIEEPGKTKIVSLLYLGNSKTIAKLDCADELKLNLHGHRITVITKDGGYIGRLPDDIGSRIKKLSDMGNVYNILVKSAVDKEVKVFINEVKTAPILKDTPTFSAEKINYISFTAPELVHKKDKIVISEEEDE